MRIDRRFGFSACAAALLLLAAAALSGTAFAVAGSAPVVAKAWIKLPAVPGRPAAAYAIITGGTIADRLLGVEGPKSARLELHTSRTGNGVTRMQPLAAIAVAPGAITAMQPGGMHVMIFSLPATRPGTRVPLTFVFEKAGRIGVRALAMAANTDARMHQR